MNHLKQQPIKVSIFQYRSFKIFISIFVGIAFYSILYAMGIFSNLPSNPPEQIPNGVFSTRFTNISHVCPDKSFVKGFDVDYKPICVPYNSPLLNITPVSTGSFSTPIAGGMPGGKFGTYFNNVLNTCSGSGIVKGFTLQGQKICVDTTGTSSVSTPALVNYGTSNMVYPTKPTSEPSGGTFQTYFTNMFQLCTDKEAIAGFGTDGTPVCKKLPVDGVCGLSANTCTIGDSVGYSAGSCGGNKTWNCSGSGGGANTNCSMANAACAVPVCKEECGYYVDWTSCTWLAGNIGGHAVGSSAPDALNRYQPTFILVSPSAIYAQSYSPAPDMNCYGVYNPTNVTCRANACNQCGSTVSWTVGGKTCSGLVGSNAISGAFTYASDDDASDGTTGSITYSCNNGTLIDTVSSTTCN